MLGQVHGLRSIGEVVHIWDRAVRANQLCGCGLPFRECPFWSEVGERAFGGWDALDVNALLALQRSVDRNRYIPFMVAPGLAPRYARRMRRYVEVLRRLYRAIEQVGEPAVIVDSTKHASYAYLLRRVPELDLHVVHLIRDARGVAYSWTKEVLKPEVVDREEFMPRYHPTRMAARWVSYNLLFHLLRLLGIPTTRLRYERLVASPEPTMGRILADAAVGASPDALGFIEGDAVVLEPTHTVAGNPMRFRQGRVELRRDDRWRDELDPTSQRTVRWLTWPMLRAYGYASDPSRSERP
jgi:hypothetical protein